MELDTLNGPCEGTLSIGGVETHVLFDTGATHSFVSPRMIGKGLFRTGTGDDPCIVNAAGGQVMHSLGLIKGIMVLITDRVMPADLIVDHRQGNACGSDCCPP